MVLSKVCRTLFELLNELHIAAGAGFIGFGVLLTHGIKTSNFIRNLFVIGTSAASLLWLLQSSDNLRPTRRKVVFITGCDSGLGMSLAMHTMQLGCTVIAGFLSLQSPGAQHLRQHASAIRQLQLDVTQLDSVETAVEAIEDFLDTNPKYELYAVINNAGVMVFGEFEWQTETQIEHQLVVNVIGAMRVTRKLTHLLRKCGGRVINVSSHCASACLPGLTVYGASKAALAAFTDGLRREMSKYGVRVVGFVPGDLITVTNIMSRHPQHVAEMRAALTPEQRSFYGDYFDRFHTYLAVLRPPSRPIKIPHQGVYKMYERALLEINPRAVYLLESWRYAIYHVLFKVAIFTSLRDYFIQYFVSLPQYVPPFHDCEDFE